jgi:hypothetical protein
MGRIQSHVALTVEGADVKKIHLKIMRDDRMQGNVSKARQR